jgi:pyruvate,orthophosphate dikinase
VKIAYSVGTMIEIPRGALTADEIAQTAEFFSFGTNDLTQTCLGMSRDDSGSFLGAYQESEIMKKNPFASIDQTGVGQLMQIAIEKGRRPAPTSSSASAANTAAIRTRSSSATRLGLTYVSCSPYRVPVARLAAAQAATTTTRSTACSSPLPKSSTSPS